jgi:hypothetical protein
MKTALNQMPVHDCDQNELIRDLWSFVENVTDDDPERTEKFFALRERVRNYFLDSSV